MIKAGLPATPGGKSTLPDYIHIRFGVVHRNMIPYIGLTIAEDGMGVFTQTCLVGGILIEDDRFSSQRAVLMQGIG